MSSIAEKLVLLNQTKTDIKAAIEAKGQTVGNIAFSQYANKIRTIKGLSPVTPSAASATNVTGKLNRLAYTKADIKTAVEACGVPVGSIPFSQYADKIRAIQTRRTFTITISFWDNTYNAGFSDSDLVAGIYKDNRWVRDEYLQANGTADVQLDAEETLQYIDIAVYNSNDSSNAVFSVYLDNILKDTVDVEAYETENVRIYTYWNYSGGNSSHKIEVREIY